MKVLVYGMQSSGSSLFTYFLAQKDNVFAIIDLQNRCRAPKINIDADSVVKVVFSTKFSLEDHCDSYEPDKKILLVRNPYDNFASLRAKRWKNSHGGIKDKFRILEENFVARDKLFDLVCHYEDFLLFPENTMGKINDLGYVLLENATEFPRTNEIIRLYNRSFTEISKRFHSKYYTGQIDFSGNMFNQSKMKRDISDEHRDMIYNLCPSVCDFYNSKLT